MARVGCACLDYKVVAPSPSTLVAVTSFGWPLAVGHIISPHLPESPYPPLKAGRSYELHESRSQVALAGHKSGVVAKFIVAIGWTWAVGTFSNVCLKSKGIFVFCMMRFLIIQQREDSRRHVKVYHVVSAIPIGPDVGGDENGVTEPTLDQ